ncbi:hypothetical protein HYT84_00700, partial [Candidatus Micrarchaeota archaeon]|nr:hypothetical protein [Candidatus Micrarchaeota archaeon]
MKEYLSICCISQSFLPYIGGLARYVESLGKQFLKHGHEFKVMHFKTANIDPIDFSEGIEVIRVNVLNLGEETLIKYMEFKETILNITHNQCERRDPTASSWGIPHSFTTSQNVTAASCGVS